MAESAIGKDGALVMKYKYQVTATEKTYDSAAAAYDAFCTSLSLDSTVSLGSYNSDDGSTVWDCIPITAISDKPFVGKLAFCSEGAIGFYDAIPTSTSPKSVTINNVSRMYAPTELPVALITFHSPYDCKSFNTKYNKNDTGICIYADHSHYNSTSGAFAVAIKITEKEILFYFEKKTTSNLLLPVYLNIFTGNNSTSQTLINQYNLGTMFFYSTMSSLKLDLKIEYSPSGDALIGNINIGTAQNVKASTLSWVESVPASTSLNVSYGISDKFNTEPSSFVLIHSGEAPLVSGNSYTQKFMWIKIHMETTDLLITPSLKNMVLEYTNTADENKIALILEPNQRLKSPETKVDVVYDESLGRLRGAAGAIDSFVQSFDPADLWKVRDPGNTEHVDITNIALTTNFMKINYQNRSFEENVGVTNIAITPTFIHVNDLGG